ncbi:hypothetical protein TKK_0016462 [Trichogramma kaykai]|uniref:NADH dehydrogenase [ubiquinone] 1 beta subcomplex subunit 4 n=1 Tax=Trichogramma kaykai TaxID=54128 RepID=A0ABD2W610_9HYME
MSANKIYDVTAKQREVIEWKAQRRIELREQYLRERHNPNAPAGHLFDPAIQRHYTLKQSLEHLFKPNVKNFCAFVGFTFLPLGLLCWRVKKYRDAKEHKYRTGQVSYKDRDWKFV